MARRAGPNPETKSLNAFPDQKAVLRTKVRAELQKLSGPEKSAASVQACARLKAQSIWLTAKTVLFYAPIDFELDVWPLLLEALKADKHVFLPRFDSGRAGYHASRILNVPKDLITGQFGIREPSPDCPEVPLKHLDLILAPGLAFDLGGRRLGRGRGYYDRLLAAHLGPACGMAYDQQIVDQVPVEPQDVSLDYVVTPTRWLDAGKRAVLK